MGFCTTCAASCTVSFVSPAAGLAILMALSPSIILVQHMIFSRMNRGTAPQVVAIRMLAFSFLPMAALCWFGVLHCAQITDSEKLIGAVYAAITYTCIAYSYFHVFNMTETARRIRILSEIDRAGGLSRDQIIAKYGTSDILQVRLDRLVQLNELELKEGRYVLKGKVLHLASSVVMVWRTVLGFPPVTTSTNQKK